MTGANHRARSSCGQPRARAPRQVQKRERDHDRPDRDPRLPVVHPPHGEVAGDHPRSRPREQAPDVAPVGVPAVREERDHVPEDEERQDDAGRAPRGHDRRKDGDKEEAEPGDAGLRDPDQEGAEPREDPIPRVEIQTASPMRQSRARTPLGNREHLPLAEGGVGRARPRRDHLRLGVEGGPEPLAPGRIELAEDVVREQHGPDPAAPVEPRGLGQPQRERDAALLPLRGEVPARRQPRTSKRRSSRCGPTSVVPIWRSLALPDSRSLRRSSPDAPFSEES